MNFDQFIEKIDTYFENHNQECPRDFFTGEVIEDLNFCDVIHFFIAGVFDQHKVLYAKKYTAIDWLEANCEESDIRFFKCYECGEITVYNCNDFYDRKFETTDCEFICRSCRDDSYYRCQECDSYFRGDESGALIDVGRNGYCFCSTDCAEEYGVYWCYSCNDYEYGTTEVYVGPNTLQHWCDDCTDYSAQYCDECSSYVSTDHSEFYEVEGRSVCQECYDETCHECESCGEVHFEGNMYYDDEEECYYCEDCRGRDNPCDVTGKSGKVYVANCVERIYSYHGYPGNWTKQLTHHESYSDALKIGVELEVYGREPSDERASAVRQIIEQSIDELGYKSNHIWASRDGSLEGRGFELISQPATAAYHLNIDGDGYDWEAGMKALLDLGYVSHDGGKCGLHFHVNRDFFEVDDPEGNVAIILANNSEWLKRFSRRRCFDYCHFSRAGECSFREDEFKVYGSDEYAKAKRRIDSVKSDMKGHYRAVNFSNLHTIEFRFVRGTLKYNTFVASIQLVHMFCHFANTTQETCASVTLRSFISLAKRLKYKEFLAYLKERQIVPDSLRNADVEDQTDTVTISVDGNSIEINTREA